MRMLSEYILVAIAVLLVLGCSETAPEPTATPVPTATPPATATPVPTPTPPATATPAPTPSPSPTPTFSDHKLGAEEIPYESLFRYNEKHVGKLVVFRARILQALEYGGSFELLAEVADPGETTIAGTVSLFYFEAPVRVLEGDKIEFIGTVVGLYTYQSVGAGPITVPQMVIEQARSLD